MEKSITERCRTHNKPTDEEKSKCDVQQDEGAHSQPSVHRHAEHHGASLDVKTAVGVIMHHTRISASETRCVSE